MPTPTRTEKLDLVLAIKDIDKALECLVPKYAEKSRELALSGIDDETFADELWVLIADQMLNSELQFATAKIREAIREGEG